MKPATANRAVVCCAALCCVVHAPQAKGMLFKAQLALEAGGPSRREQRQEDRLKAKAAWRQSQQQQQPMQ
jgi:hypothetical protein